MVCLFVCSQPDTDFHTRPVIAGCLFKVMGGSGERGGSSATQPGLRWITAGSDSYQALRHPGVHTRPARGWWYSCQDKFILPGCGTVFDFGACSRYCPQALWVYSALGFISTARTVKTQSHIGVSRLEESDQGSSLLAPQIGPRLTTPVPYSPCLHEVLGISSTFT